MGFEKETDYGLRLLDGTKINASVGYKNLKIIEMRKNYLIEQRKVG